MLVFHFVTTAEYKKLCNEINSRNDEKIIEELLNRYPEVKEGAEDFFNFLKEERANRAAWEKVHGVYTYNARPEPVPENVKYYDRTAHRERDVLVCLERYIGNGLYNRYVWELPETQKAVTETRVAADDFYTQYESNPDGAVDVLDGMRNRSNYSNEAKKIEQGIKRGKYENK